MVEPQKPTQEKDLKREREIAQDVFTEDDLREKRYLWTARVFAVFAAVSLCANIIMVIALSSLLPLVRVESFLLEFKNKNEQIIRVIPFRRNLIEDRDITESLIQQYVLLRNTVTSNYEEMTQRWGVDGPVRYMSTEAVFGEFVQKNTPILVKLKDEGFTRDVFIRTATRTTTRGAQAYWQVDMRTRDMLPTRASPEETCWTVGLEIGYFYNSRVKYEDRLKNPLGFMVSRYAMQPKECD